MDSQRSPKLAYFEITKLFNNMSLYQSEIKSKNIIESDPELFFKQLYLEKILNVKREIRQDSINEFINLSQESMVLNMITMTPLQDFRFIYNLFTITRAKMEN